MPPTATSRTPRGVEFSDHLVVLGPSPSPLPPTAQTYSHALPTPQALAHNRHPTPRDVLPSLNTYHPTRSSSASPFFANTIVEDDDSIPFNVSPALPYRNNDKRRARFFESPPLSSSHDNLSPSRPYDEQVETSCTDSEEDHGSYRKKPSEKYTSTQVQESIEKSTRLNTKLNSLPSGGAFSLMNSSEDVDLSSSDDENDPTDRSSSRRLVRVDGSAKLSTASGLAEDAFDIEEDEFAIEGAELVDEEEAVNVRSFGRSFARVCLKEGIEEDQIQKPTQWGKDKSHVSFDLPGDDLEEGDNATRGEEAMTSDTASGLSARSGQKGTDQRGFTESQSVPPQRKSRLRLTFARRASVTDTGEPKPTDKDRMRIAGDGLDDTMGDATRLSCFPMRRSPTRQSSRRGGGGGDSRGGLLGGMRLTRDHVSGRRPPVVGGGTGEVVAIPELNVQDRNSSRPKSGRKLVKNISMQRDDWIDFATNAPTRQRSPWLVRLISHSAAESEVSSRRDSQGLAAGVSQRPRNSMWKAWRPWNRK